VRTSNLTNISEFGLFAAADDQFYGTILLCSWNWKENKQDRKCTYKVTVRRVYGKTGCFNIPQFSTRMTRYHLLQPDLPTFMLQPMSKAHNIHQIYHFSHESLSIIPPICRCVCITAH